MLKVEEERKRWSDAYEWCSRCCSACWPRGKRRGAARLRAERHRCCRLCKALPRCHLIPSLQLGALPLRASSSPIGSAPLCFGTLPRGEGCRGQSPLPHGGGAVGISSAHDAMGSVAYVTKEQYLFSLFLVRIVGTSDFGALFSAFARGALGQ